MMLAERLDWNSWQEKFSRMIPDKKLSLADIQDFCLIRREGLKRAVEKLKTGFMKRSKSVKEIEGHRFVITKNGNTKRWIMTQS
jgi:hypothetical protein